MGQAYSLKRLDAIEAYTERLTFIEQHFSELTSVTLTRTIGMCLYQHQLINKSSDVDADGRHRKQLHKTAKVTVQTSSGSLCGSVKQKFWLRAYLVFPELVCSVRNMLGIGV